MGKDRDIFSSKTGWAKKDSKEFGASHDIEMDSKFRDCKMKSPPTWGLSGKSTVVVITTAWISTVVIGIALGFLLLANIPSFLASSLIREPGPPAGFSRQNAAIETRTSLPILPSNFPPIFTPPIQNLLNDLKQARRLAEGDEHESNFTVEEMETWAREHPCRARSELPPLYASRQVVADAPANPQWTLVFEEYSHLHRTCMRKVGNDVSDVFNSKRIIPGCKFVTGESLFGLGNKITFAASVLLYAVITKRVVLFPHGTASIMCEPFEGSSWTLPSDLEHLNRRLQENGLNVGVDSNVTDSFLSWVDEVKGIPSSVAEKVDNRLFHAEADDGWHPVNRFFCDTEQEFLSNVEWVSTAGCLYFLPKLYAIPSLRPTLEALFPQPGLTLTYVMRSAFLPDDEAWDRVQRIYAVHLENADRRVSIQARYRGGKEEHDNYAPHVNAHILKCLQENEILPNVTRDFSSSQNFVGRTPIVKVMITSLYTDLQDYLNEIYLRHSTVTGESVGLIQVTHENEQEYGREVDTQAFVEIICLSLSDVILVTPLSTFGGAAQVYGALAPWIVEFSDQEEGSCTRSPSVDLCYQADDAHSVLLCPYDVSVNGSHVLEAASYMKNCSPMESEGGILLTLD